MSTSAGLPIVEELRRLEGAAGRRRTVLPFGIKEIDRHLPGGGLPLGALHDVFGGGNGAIDGAAAALFTRELAIGHAAGCCGASFGRTSSPRPLRKQGCCQTPLASPDRGDRLQTADGVRHPLARHRAPLNPLACSRRWTRPMAGRIDPVSCR
jgi:hypothetical protein